MAEEIANVKNDLSDASMEGNQQVQWEKAFTSCFLKVDDEIGGKGTRGTIEDAGHASEATSEPLAPETVGSTAVVALVCSSHIIVANCGDSRAVLYRGKESIALSVDHKVRLMVLHHYECMCIHILIFFSSFFLINIYMYFCFSSQTEKMNMQELRLLEAR